MSRNKELTESEMAFIIEQSGMDISIVKSWYKGKVFFNFKSVMVKKQFDLTFIPLIHNRVFATVSQRQDEKERLLQVLQALKRLGGSQLVENIRSCIFML